jgi:hypothetical protein
MSNDYNTAVRTQDTRGFKVRITVPATLEDFDKAAGAGQAYVHAIDESLYRSVMPKAWAKFMELAPAHFGFTRPVIGTKQSKRNPEAAPVEVLQDIKDYLPALKAHLAATERSSELGPFVQSCFDLVGYDLSSTPRKAKPQKEWLDRAQALLDKIARGDSTIEASAAKFAEKGITGAYVTKEDGTYDLEILATKVKEFFLAQEDLL